MMISKSRQNPLARPRREREGPTPEVWEGEGLVFREDLALTLPLRGSLPLPAGLGEGKDLRGGMR